jgi:hypothetical protein
MKFKEKSEIILISTKHSLFKIIYLKIKIVWKANKIFSPPNKKLMIISKGISNKVDNILQ